MGRVREAAEQFLLAVRSESDNPDYHFDLGNVEFVLRRDLTAAWKIDSAELLQRALFEFREASRLAPMNLEYARAYAETFYGMPNPDWEEAQIAWQHYLELSTDRNFAYLQLARVSLKRHKKAEALSFLDKVSDFSYSEVKEKLRKQVEAPRRRSVKTEPNEACEIPRSLRMTARLFWAAATDSGDVMPV